MFRRSFRSSSSNKGTPTTKRRKPSAKGRRGSGIRKEDAGEDEDSDWASAPITLTLGNCSLTYDNGKWHGEVREKDNKEGTRKAGGKGDEDAPSKHADPATKDYIRKLKEENRLLKFKVEVLVDMLTLARAENEER